MQGWTYSTHLSFALGLGLRVVMSKSTWQDGRPDFTAISSPHSLCPNKCVLIVFYRVMRYSTRGPFVTIGRWGIENDNDQVGDWGYTTIRSWAEKFLAKFNPSNHKPTGGLVGNKGMYPPRPGKNSTRPVPQGPDTHLSAVFAISIHCSPPVLHHSQRLPYVIP